MVDAALENTLSNSEEAILELSKRGAGMTTLFLLVTGVCQSLNELGVVSVTKKWSGQNRTNRTTCYGPDFVSILLLVYVWSLQFLGTGSSNLWVHSLKSLGKGSLCQRLLQIIIRLNTLVDVIRVPKVRTSGE